VEGARLPSTATNENNIEHSRDMILLDKSAIIDEVVNRLKISHGSGYKIVHNRLGFHEVCAEWVPTQLSTFHKRTRTYGNNIWIPMVINVVPS
jgi:hypothetical protein